MFSIFNGRTSFYQWDVDQKLIINCNIPDYQVHFENTSDEVCYTLEPYEMDGKTVVNVPNLLLQNSTPIIVWCYVLDKNGNYTIKSKTFAVIERQKPSDYVYTETEVLSFNSKLDKNVGAENAGKALIVGEDGNIVFEDTNKNSDAVLYTKQNLTAAQQKQARTNIDVASYNVINYLWPTEHSGREDTDITTLLENNVYIGIVRNSTAFPSPGLVMLQGPMTGNVYFVVLLAKDGLTYTATFQYVISTKHVNVLDPVEVASSKLISVKLTHSESGENVCTADRDIGDIDEALQAGHMALAYVPDAAGLQNRVGLITSCVRTERGSPHFVTVLQCFDTFLVSTKWQVDLDGRTWTGTAFAEYATIDLVANLEMAMPKPVYKTDAMTQAVGMDETGKLWTQPGASGGSAETWELIASGEMSEAATLSLTKDADGTALALKSCCILIDGALTCVKGQYICFRAARYVSGTDYDRYDAEMHIEKDNPSVRAAYVCEYGKPPFAYIDSGKSSIPWQITDAAVFLGIHRNYASGYDFTPTQHTLNMVYVGQGQGSGKLGAGCKYALWGVRA